MLLLKTYLSVFSFICLSANPVIAQEKGLASFYGDAFHGSRTASGENYDRNEMTGAHKTLPFGTYVKVTRVDNGRSVVIKINDRGPYIKGRVIDVSRKAAEKLGMVNDGVVEVTVEKTSKSAGSSTTSARTPKPAPAPAPKKEVEVEEPAPAPKVIRVSKKDDPKKVIPKPEPKPAAKSSETKLKLVNSNTYNDYDLYKIQVLRPAKEGYGVQVASLTDFENVLKQIAKLQEDHFKNILTSVERGANGSPHYKIMLGPFPEIETANAYKRSLEKKHKIKGFVVTLGDIQY